MTTSGFEPADVRPVYKKVEAALLVLLRDLAPEDWQRLATPKWTVKDVVAHLVDGHLRELAMGRDCFFGESPGDINSYADLVAFLNRLNADWVSACRRLSPGVLIDWIENSSRDALAYYDTLDLKGPALFPVAWAGEDRSNAAFHLARQLTERWHHQQQIRAATGREAAPAPITVPELYHPVLATFMCALPHHYRTEQAVEGTCVEVIIEGEAGGDWTIASRGSRWEFVPKQEEAAARVHIPEKLAWRLFTKGLNAASAGREIRIEGDKRLGDHLLTITAVMA